MEKDKDEEAAAAEKKSMVRKSKPITQMLCK